MKEFANGESSKSRSDDMLSGLVPTGTLAL
jgi:hypothetical protein